MTTFFFKKKLNPQRFHEIFDEYFESLRAYVYYQSGDEEMAKDIAQEAFLKLWEKRSTINLETVKAYLYQTAGNIFIDKWRQQKVRLKFESFHDKQALAESPEEVLWDKELKERLESAISEMQELHRVAFMMSRHEGLSYSEISVRLGVGEKAIEKRISVALKHLREAFPEIDVKFFSRKKS